MKLIHLCKETTSMQRTGIQSAVTYRDCRWKIFLFNNPLFRILRTCRLESNDQLNSEIITIATIVTSRYNIFQHTFTKEVTILHNFQEYNVNM